MNISHFLKILLLTTFTLFTVAACDDGPGEEVGEAFDNSIDEVKDSAEDIGDEVKDVCDDATDGDC